MAETHLSACQCSPHSDRQIRHAVYDAVLLHKCYLQFDKQANLKDHTLFTEEKDEACAIKRLAAVIEAST
jgi:hypothetical protein